MDPKEKGDFSKIISSENLRKIKSVFLQKIKSGRVSCAFDTDDTCEDGHRNING